MKFVVVMILIAIVVSGAGLVSEKWEQRQQEKSAADFAVESVEDPAATQTEVQT